MYYIGMFGKENGWFLKVLGRCFGSLGEVFRVILKSSTSTIVFFEACDRELASVSVSVWSLSATTPREGKEEEDGTQSR